MSHSTVKGIYRDRLVGAGGRALFDTGWRPNLIVANCRVLVAAFMKGDGLPDRPALGIQSLKVGRGDPAWDLNPVAPDESLTALVDPTPFPVPKGDLTLRYLDASGQVSTAPTSRLEVVAKLGPNQPPITGSQPYPLREFGLFGHMAGQAAGEDFLIEYVRHPLIEKDKVVTLERRIQLFF